MAPERMEGGGSVRSDIFSAGAVMYWLVFGIRPWETEFWREETVKWALELPEDEAGSEFVQSIREDVHSRSIRPDLHLAAVFEFCFDAGHQNAEALLQRYGTRLFPDEVSDRRDSDEWCAGRAAF